MRFQDRDFIFEQLWVILRDLIGVAERIVDGKIKCPKRIVETSAHNLKVYQYLLRALDELEEDVKA